MPGTIDILVVLTCVIGNMTRIMSRDLFPIEVIPDEKTKENPSIHLCRHTSIGIAHSNKARCRLDLSDMAAMFGNTSCLNRVELRKSTWYEMSYLLYW